MLACICGTASAVPRKSAPARASASNAAARAIAVQIREQADGQVGRFYAGRGFWPLWASAGRIGPEAGALLNVLESARLDGLKPNTYKIDELRGLLRAASAGDAAAVARADLAMSRALARYVGDVRRPSHVEMIWLDKALKPKRLRADAVLRAASLPKSLGTYISDMQWMSPHYVRLRGLLAQARRAGGSEETERRLRLNLDRARLLPGAWTHHIVVDAASARLWYYQAGKQQGTMRVVVGAKETPTPMLAGMVRYAILNPYWNVPVDLTQRRIAPKILAGGSLKAMRYEALSDWTAAARPLDQRAIDWRAVAAGDREVRVRQLPGGANSMGRVKFMFPNEQGIYLHDTPDKALLAKSERHFSNGCVRLEDAPRLGRWLLGKRFTTTSKRPEQGVALTQPVPVYLTYFTVAAGPKGVTMIKDVYGRDGS